MQFFMGLKKTSWHQKVFLVEKMSRFSKKGRQKVSLVPNVGSPIKHFNCSENDAFLEQKKRLETSAQVEPFLPRLLFALLTRWCMPPLWMGHLMLCAAIILNTKLNFWHMRDAVYNFNTAQAYFVQNCAIHLSNRNIWQAPELFCLWQKHRIVPSDTEDFTRHVLK